ncbi:MAG: hypothetical protein ACPGVU_19680 [Limisphaerales bacterium]
MNKFTNQIRGAVLLAAGVIIGSFFSPSINPPANAQANKDQWRYQTIHGTGKSIFNSINTSLNNGYELVDMKTTPQNGYSTPYTVAVLRVSR